MPVLRVAPAFLPVWFLNDHHSVRTVFRSIRFQRNRALLRSVPAQLIERYCCRLPNVYAMLQRANFGITIRAERRAEFRVVVGLVRPKAAGIVCCAGGLCGRG